jgi:hypothetical protein
MTKQATAVFNKLAPKKPRDTNEGRWLLWERMIQKKSSDHPYSRLPAEQYSNPQKISEKDHSKTALSSSAFASVFLTFIAVGTSLPLDPDSPSVQKLIQD